MKSIGEMPENSKFHPLVLAYASDYNLF
ncbi:MAG: hypothetical protein ACK49K_05855 [Bacteroidota bacterium]